MYDYTAILAVLLIVSLATNVAMFYEGIKTNKDIDTYKKEMYKIKIEYGRIYENYKTLYKANKEPNKQCLKFVINDIEKELTALNGITTGITEHNRRRDLEATNKILKERLNND